MPSLALLYNNLKTMSVKQCSCTTDSISSFTINKLMFYCCGTIIINVVCIAIGVSLWDGWTLHKSRTKSRIWT